MENSDLLKMPVVHLLKFAETFSGIEVHLPVNGKFVKLNYAEDQFVDILRKLQQKEVNDVYIRPDDCKRIMDKVKESMSAQTFYDPDTIPEQRVESNEAAMQVVKQVIRQLGVDAETVRLLTTINARAMSILSESPSLYAFIRRFKKNCSEEYLRTILTSYLMALIIDKFPWRSDLVKEKGALASILCDLLLEKGDFLHVREWEKNGTEMPEHVKQHPLDVAQNLRQKRNLVPNETLTIIEQHHELPNGKGFPNGIQAGRFNQLSCIFILSQQFIENLFEANFDFDRRLDIINHLQKRYEAKNFEKAMNALISVVDQ